MEILVLGPGCKKCCDTERLVREVVEETGVDATVAKIADLQQIVRMGVFATPAVAVDGKVKCVGKVPSKADVASWLVG